MAAIAAPIRRWRRRNNTRSMDGGPPVSGPILDATARDVEARVIQTTVRAEAQAALDELNRQQS